MAFGHTFRSYSYPYSRPLRSGDTTTCIVTTPDGHLAIEDTYWTEDDYTSALEHAGLTVATVVYPLPRDAAAWATDEATVPPSIVIKATKAQDKTCGRRPLLRAVPRSPIPGSRRIAAAASTGAGAADEGGDLRDPRDREDDAGRGAVRALAGPRGSGRAVLPA